MRNETQRIQNQTNPIKNWGNATKLNNRIAVQRYEPKTRRNATKRTQNKTNL